MDKRMGEIGPDGQVLYAAHAGAVVAVRRQTDHLGEEDHWRITVGVVFGGGNAGLVGTHVTKIPPKSS